MTAPTFVGHGARTQATRSVDTRPDGRVRWRRWPCRASKDLHQHRQARDFCLQLLRLALCMSMTTQIPPRAMPDQETNWTTGQRAPQKAPRIPPRDLLPAVIVPSKYLRRGERQAAYMARLDGSLCSNPVIVLRIRSNLRNLVHIVSMDRVTIASASQALLDGAQHTDSTKCAMMCALRVICLCIMPCCNLCGYALISRCDAMQLANSASRCRSIAGNCIDCQSQRPLWLTANPLQYL